MKRRLIAISATAAGIITAVTAGAFLASSPAKPRVLFVGDSLTAGYYATTMDDSFPSRVVSKLVPTEVTEAARAHQNLTTVSAIAEVPDNLSLAVIELGTNDVGQETPLRDFSNQYSALIASIHEKSKDATVLCVSTWTDYGAAYDQAIKAACEDAGGAYVPITDLFTASNTRGPVGQQTHVGKRDAFHPNDAGHYGIAARILEYLPYYSPELLAD